MPCFLETSLMRPVPEQKNNKPLPTDDTMLKAVIVDDEPNCSKTLELLLGEFCVEEIELLRSFNQPQQALAFLKEVKIDLLFLDIDMPQLNGFQLLDLLQPVKFHIIFTTAYDHYAIRAFKYSAYDYLLKPIDETELTAAVNKLSKQHAPIDNRHAEHLLRLYKDPQTVAPQRIALPTTDGFEFIETADIIRCESDSNYTRFYFSNTQPPMLVCRTLKDIETILGNSGFLRVHNSHLINKKKVKKYVKTDGGYILMVDASQIPVARSKKATIMNDLLQ